MVMFNVISNKKKSGRKDMWRHPTHVFDIVRVSQITLSRMQVMSIMAESTYNLRKGKTTHCFLL